MPSELLDVLEARIRAIVREELALALAGKEPTSEYLSTVEAALVAKVHEGTIRKWIKQERLADHSAGREYRVRRDELEALMAPGQRRRAPRAIKGRPEISPEAAAMRDLGL